MFNGECNLAAIWLYSRDPGKTAEFYENVLGMKRVTHSGVYSFNGGGMRLSIHEAPEGRKVPNDECFLVFYVREGIEERYQELKKRGVRFESEIDEEPYGKTAGFRDPDGHQLFLWQPPSRDSENFNNVFGMVEHYENILSRLDSKNPIHAPQRSTGTGQMVEFEAGTGRGTGYLAVPKTSAGGVLVLHAWWGLNDFFKSFCDRLAREGYTALAPDLRHGVVAQTVSEAKELMSKGTPEVSRNEVLGAIEYLRSHPSAKGRRVGAVGFSMGAAWALWLSTERPMDVAAVVAFYGTEPTDFSKAQASYLGHYAPDDEWEPTSEVRALEEKIRAAGKDVNFHFYQGAKHWFFEENRPVEYNRNAADLAWNRTLEFLSNKLL